MKQDSRRTAAWSTSGRRAGLMLVIVLGLGGCAAPPRTPNLRDLYQRAAELPETERNPVIVIPGILGSKLRDGASGRLVWGAFSGDFANPDTPDGARLFTLPMRPGVALRELRDGVRPDGVLDRLKLKLFGLPVELKAYFELIAILGAAHYRDEELARAGAVNYGEDHFTCFQFAYDWRRDNVENARLLYEFVREKKAYVEAEFERRYGVKKDVQFDIVAHSMGGLVARYFLKYGDLDLPDEGPLPDPTWAGARMVRRAILVGTPNSGSILAVKNLIEGRDYGPIVPVYRAALLGTFPSIYQLMPRPRHHVVHLRGSEDDVDIFDPSLWERFGWGLADRDQLDVLRVLLPDAANDEQRCAIAREHLAKCLRRAERFAAAMDRPSRRPDSLDLVLYAGDALPTAATGEVDPESGAFRIVSRAPGDGIVLRSSALMDERAGDPGRVRVESPIPWSRVQFLFTNHQKLTSDPAFADNLLFQLLETSD